jgi:hypothetical protein
MGPTVTSWVGYKDYGQMKQALREYEVGYQELENEVWQEGEG